MFCSMHTPLPPRPTQEDFRELSSVDNPARDDLGRENLVYITVVTEVTGPEPNRDVGLVQTLKLRDPSTKRVVTARLFGTPFIHEFPDVEPGMVIALYGVKRYYTDEAELHSVYDFAWLRVSFRFGTDDVEIRGAMKFLYTEERFAMMEKLDAWWTAEVAAKEKVANVGKKKGGKMFERKSGEKKAGPLDSFVKRRPGPY